MRPFITRLFNISLSILLLAALGVAGAAQEHQQHDGQGRGRGRGGQGMGQGMGQGGGGMKDMQTIHSLFDHHQQITRTVKQLANGVETVTESNDPKVQALIKEHAWAMKVRLEKKQPIRMWDPLFAALFQHADKIKFEIVDTAKGVRVIETSADPYVAKLIKSHAAGVSEFVKEGQSVMHKSHELPEGDPPHDHSSQSQRPAESRVRAELLVSTAWLAENLNDQGVVALHVARDRKSYDDGHAPGARFLALGDILATRDGVPNELPSVEQLQKVFANLGIGNAGRIVIYGDNYGLSAARAFYTLDYLGYGDRAALLDGGLEKWKAEKRALETQPAKFEAAPFTPRLRPNVVVGLNAMRDLSWSAANVSDSDAAIIDARPEDQYVGNPNPRSGHIPGAANIYWMKHLKSGSDLTMKPAAELLKMFEEAGLKPGQKAVAYCNTGVQASHTYFTLKYLGFDAMMYDASFAEWGKVEGAPVVAGKEKNK